MTLGMFLFKEIPDAAPYGAGEVPRGATPFPRLAPWAKGRRRYRGLIWFNSQIYCLRHEHGNFT